MFIGCYIRTITPLRMCISLGVSIICVLLQNQGNKGCLKLKDMLIAYHNPIFQSGRSVLCIRGLVLVIDLSDVHLHILPTIYIYMYIQQNLLWQVISGQGPSLRFATALHFHWYMEVWMIQVHHSRLSGCTWNR